MIRLSHCLPPVIIVTAVTCMAPAQQWYRGNTHAHTEICGHADSTPEAVAKWYLDHGYHFLVLSEHNHFIDPATVALPDPRREDFILIPGEEVTFTRLYPEHGYEQYFAWGQPAFIDGGHK